jgi:hypothetical protein
MPYGLGKENKMFAIWCEWDIGHEEYIFSNRANAETWLTINWPEDTGFENWQEAWADGLVGLKVLIMDPK